MMIQGMTCWRLAALVFFGAVLSACGGGGGDGGSVPPPAGPGEIKLLAGSLHRPGSADGAAAVAQFNDPRGVAVDSAGNIYVADGANHTIRKIGKDGTVSTLAGSAGQAGSTDGAAAAARFSRPHGVAIGPQGDLYVADTDNHTIRKISKSGSVSTLAGAAGQSGAVDGSGSAARFNFPRALAVDASGNVFVGDTNGAVRKVRPDGVVTTFAGKIGDQRVAFGDADQARFVFVQGLAVDASGVVYVADYVYGAGTAGLRRFDSQGRALPWGNAPVGIVTVPTAMAIAVGAHGDLVVAGTGVSIASPSISFGYGTILRVTADGEVIRVAGQDGRQSLGHVDGPGAQARFYFSQGLTVDASGRILVGDTLNHAVRSIDLQGNVSTVAGGAGIGYVDGLGAAARFFGPGSIAAGPDGSLYVADVGNVKLRRITPAGLVSTVSFLPDGSAAPRSVGGVAVARDGTLYITAAYSATTNGLIAVTPDGRRTDLGAVFGSIVSAAPAGGLYLSNPSTGTLELLMPDWTTRVLIASGLRGPGPVVVDPAGTIYVAEWEAHTVTAVDPLTGTKRVVAGEPGEPGYADGAGRQARFDRPWHLAADGSGNIYVADAGTIRRVTPQGQVTRIAGTPGEPFGGPGPLPGSIGVVNGLAWSNGMLYATVFNSVLAIGPVR